VTFEQMQFPLKPTVLVTGLIPEKAFIFKSATQPLGLRYTTTKQKEFMVLCKTGDDLRQDQLVVQLITLIDKLWKKENLDLKLTPYKVLAMSSRHGLVECVTPSESMASVIGKYAGDIQAYFRKHHPDSAGPYGISNHVVDNFVRSCAGYCVITYILGIGDRHLDNLLIDPSGHLFHIDFGFILGRDPKPFPPPFKLCREMVQGMGGMNSHHWIQFKQLCCEAYNIIRKSTNLILNLVTLMVDANIPDISEEPEKSLLKLQEKLRTDLPDEEAIQVFQALINESVNALFSQITETIHRWSQYWRN